MRTPVGVVEDTNGNLYVSNYGGGIIKISPNGENSEFSSDFGRPGVGITITNNNMILATDNGDDLVRRVNSDGSSEVIVDNIGGCVALLVHENVLYVSSWSNGAVYAYALPEK